jgi:hypothetical protein
LRLPCAWWVWGCSPSRWPEEPRSSLGAAIPSPSRSPSAQMRSLMPPALGAGVSSATQSAVGAQSPRGLNMMARSTEQARRYAVVHPGLCLSVCLFVGQCAHVYVCSCTDCSDLTRVRFPAGRLQFVKRSIAEFLGVLFRGSDAVLSQAQFDGLGMLIRGGPTLVSQVSWHGLSWCDCLHGRHRREHLVFDPLFLALRLCHRRRRFHHWSHSFYLVHRR